MNVFIVHVLSVDYAVQFACFKQWRGFYVHRPQMQQDLSCVLTARYCGPSEFSPVRFPHMEAALSCCICCCSCWVMRFSFIVLLCYYSYHFTSNKVLLHLPATYLVHFIYSQSLFYSHIPDTKVTDCLSNTTGGKIIIFFIYVNQLKGSSTNANKNNKFRNLITNF